MNEINITCPYCHQAITILIDIGFDGHSEVVEDCEVCCRPIEISYVVRDQEIETYSYSAIEGNEF